MLSSFSPAQLNKYAFLSAGLRDPFNFLTSKRVLIYRVKILLRC